MAMNIQKAKLELIQWLTTLEDTSLIQKIIELRKTESRDWWNDLSEAEKESIKLGMSDAQCGKLKPTSEARKIYEKWL